MKVQMMTGAALAVSAFATSGPSAGFQPVADAQAPIPNLAGKVLTVKGPVDPASLGQTLMHEHIFIDFAKPAGAIPAPGPVKAPVDFKPNRLENFDESLAEVSAFKKLGGGTIVDVTNIGLTRDPDKLLRIADASGLQVVMGAGWYQKAFHADDMSSRTVEELTDVIVRDITVGAQGGRIRSGIIGEVGVNGRPLVDNELKSVRASARASRLTGAPITIHGLAAEDELMRVLDVIQSEGVDLHHVVMGHQARREIDFMKMLFARGVYVEFDFMGQAEGGPGPNAPPVGGAHARDEALIDKIDAVIKAGYAKQLILSHDVCIQAQLKKNGGGGFTYISEVVVPGLRKRGVSDADIKTILVDNPRRVLTFVAPQPQLANPRMASR